MIGFIRVADIPRLLISVLVGIVLLCLLFGLLLFAGVRKLPTSIVQLIFLCAFACVFYLSVKIGDSVWDQIEGMRETSLRPELKQMIATDLRIRQLKRGEKVSDNVPANRKGSEPQGKVKK